MSRGKWGCSQDHDCAPVVKSTPLTADWGRKMLKIEEGALIGRHLGHGSKSHGSRRRERGASGFGCDGAQFASPGMPQLGEIDEAFKGLVHDIAGIEFEHS